MRQDVLTRYSEGQQAVVNAVVQLLDESELRTTTVLLEELEIGRIDFKQHQEILSAVQTALSDLQKHGAFSENPALKSAMGGFSESLDSPKLDLTNKLKLSIPIIPFLLNYETEMALKNGINLKTLWQALKGHTSR